MKVKSIKIEKFDETVDFYDITTQTGNFVIADTHCVVHNSHIATLLITAFLRIFPDLIKTGHIYKAILPLYGVNNFKGKFVPFYTVEEMQKFHAENPKVEISRYKGLGEMMPAQLNECLLNPSVRHLQQLKSDEDPEPIFKLMTDAESKRELITEDEES